MASTSRAKYQDICQRLRQNLRNNSKFKSALLDLHLALHDEEDITHPAPKEAYDSVVKIYEEGKYKGLKCLHLFYYVMADAHYKFAQDSKTNEAFSKAKEMFSKSVQAGGWKFSDEDRDVFFANQIAVFYSESCSTIEDRELFLRDVDKMVKSCLNAKGPSACICHFYKGMTLWKQSKSDEALTSFRTSLKMTANTPVAKLSQYLGQHQIYTQIGRCHYDMTNYKLAIANFDKVIANYDPNDDKSLKAGLISMYQRGLSLRKLNKFDEAFSALESFVNFMETNRLATELKQTEEFQMYLTVARKLISELVVELRRPEEMSTALKLKNEPDRLDRFSDADQAYTEGDKFFKKNRFAKALKAFQKCLDIKLEIFHGVLPSIDFRQIHAYLGFSCANLEMHQDAIEHFTLAEDCLRKSSTLNKDKSMLISVRNELALAYGKLNYDQESLHFLKKVADLSAVNMNDTLAETYYNIARLLWRMRHYDEALKSYHKYLRIDKSEENCAHKSLACMAKCYLKVGKNKKALECVDRGLKYIQSRPNLQDWVHIFKQLKGRCLLAMDKPNEALNYLTEAKTESENWTLAQFKKDKTFEINPEVIEVIQKSLPFVVNVMHQVMCKKKLYGNSHPDLNETFHRFCSDETDLKIINEAFTFDNESDQELTRCFLDFFGSKIKNEQITSRFLSRHRNSIKRFHNSALISDFFRHAPTKNFDRNKH